MSSAWKFLVAFALAAILSRGAFAQGSVTEKGIVTQKILSLGMAKSIAEATLGECKAKGFHTSAAVVDRSGQLLVLLRDEQATPQTAEMARRKALTARVFRTTTLEFQKHTADPAFAA